jgi:hypothetical protein
MPFIAIEKPFEQGIYTYPQQILKSEKAQKMPGDKLIHKLSTGKKTTYKKSTKPLL